MILEGIIRQNGSPILVPEIFKDKVCVLQTCLLNEQEIFLIHQSFNAIHKQMEVENLIDFRRVDLIFTATGTVSLSMESSPEELGSHVSLCVFAVEKWREREYGKGRILIVLLEELCQHFFAIEDEERLKHKVLEVMRIINPEIEMHHLYNPV